MTDLSKWVGASLADVGINLVAAGIGGAAVWIAGHAFRGFRQYRGRRFWRRFASGGVTVVIGNHAPAETVPWETSGLIGIGDVDGVLSLQKQLTALHLPLDVTFARDLRAAGWRKRNLVLLGGPDANEVTDNILQHMKPEPTFVFEHPREHVVALVDTREKRVLGPENAPDGSLRHDYAIIVRAVNPFDHTKEVIIVAGCWGYGTAAAADALATREFLRHPICASGRSFESVIRTAVAGGLHHEPEIIEARLLGETAGAAGSN